MHKAIFLARLLRTKGQIKTGKFLVKECLLGEETVPLKQLFSLLVLQGY